MKKSIRFILAFMLLFSGAQAQSDSVSIYGFRQQTTGGMQKRGDIDESGKLVKKKPAPVYKYAVYLTTKSKERIYPVQMWLNGKAFSVNAKAKTVDQLLKEDVKRYGEKVKSVVYDAGETIWELNRMPLAVEKGTEQGKSLAASNDVVVLYKIGETLHYGVLKKFTEAEPGMLQ